MSIALPPAPRRITERGHWTPSGGGKLGHAPTITTGSGVAIQTCALRTVGALRQALEKGGYRDRVIFGMGGVAEPEDGRTP